MANLVLTTILGLLGGMLNVNKKSYVMSHVITLEIFGTSKSYTFGKITKRCLIDSTP